MGKSALLRALGSEAAATGWRVLATAGEEFGRHIPYRCIAELVSGLPRAPNDERRAIVEHQAVPSGLDITPLVFHSALLEILSDAADAQPLAVLIDDAAWLDDASSSAIAFVLRRLHRDKVAVFLADRGTTQSWWAPVGLTTVELRGLGVDSAAELLGAGQPVDCGVASVCVAQTSGNPLALIELGRMLTSAQLRGTQALPDPVPLGPLSQAGLDLRLSLLSPSTQRAACLLAMEESGDVGAVRRALGAAKLDDAALAELEQHQLVRLDGGTLTWVHPLHRAGAYYGTLAAERRSLHRCLATALADTDPFRSAWHLGKAATGPDSELSRQLASTAAELERRAALSHAGAVYELAASLESMPSELLLLRSSAECYLRGGHLDEARRVARRGVERAESAEDSVDHMALWGEAETWSTGPAAGAALMLAHVRRLRADDPRGVLLRCHTALALLLACEVRRMAEVAAEAAAVPAGQLDPLVVNFRDLVHGHALARCGDLEAALPLLEKSRAFVDTVIELSPRHADTLVYLLAVIDIATEQYERTERLLRRLIARTLTLGLSAGFADIFLADLLWRTGRWSESHSLLSNVAEISHDLGQTTQRMAASALLARAEACIGRFESADSLGAESLDYGTTTRHAVVAYWARSALAIGALAKREYEEARRHLEAIRDNARQAGEGNPGVLWWQGDYLEALCGAGCDGLASTELENLAGDVQAPSSTWIKATVMVNNARLDRANDPGPRLGSAADALAGLPAPFERARALLAWAEHPRAGQGAVEARKAATRIFESLGAIPWADRARGGRELSSPNDATRGLAAVLTPSELRVAMAVGSGLPNKQAATELYLSAKTVEYHLNNVYRKLRIQRRGELIRLITAEQARHVDSVPG